MTDTIICTCGYSFDHQYLKQDELLVKNRTVIGCKCRHCSTEILYDDSTPLRR